MTAYDIRPYDGAGPLKLGMLPAEVHNILGQPRSTGKNILGERSDNYPNLTTTFARDTGKLAEVGFCSRVNVQYEGIDLFADPLSVEQLTALDGAPLETVGFIMFPSLGIVLGDFDGDQVGDRTVSIFERGRWDQVPNMAPFIPR